MTQTAEVYRLKKDDLIKYLNMGGGVNLRFFDEQANKKIEEFCQTAIAFKKIDAHLSTGNSLDTAN